MAALATAFVAVLPQTDRFEPEMKKKLAKVDGTKAGVSIGQSLGGGMRLGVSKTIPGIAKGLIAGFAALKGLQVFGGFITDAQESAKVARLTAQVIKTTGGAAKITAGQVDTLATSLSNKTGIDDEAVQSGSNLLLTFKNIKREGTGLNDVFGRATAAALDLSAAGFGDINGASKALGKALNDPLKGITALGRAGVTFTEQQKRQIKALVETGNVLGAQKIILKEVESQVGGAAAAAADPITKLRTIVGNLGEDVGTFLLPYIDKFASFLTDRAVPAVKSLGKFIGESFGIIRSAFNDPDITSSGFAGVLEQVGVTARHAFDYFQTDVLPRLKQFGGFLRDDAVPALADFGSWLSRNRAWLIPIVAGILAIVAAVKIWTAVSTVFVAVQGLVNLVLTANPIGIVVLAIVGLVAALVVAYKTSDTFRAIVQRAWAGIQVAASVAWNSVLKPVFSALNFFVRSVLGPTVAWLWNNVFVPAFNGIKAIIQVVWPIVRGILQTWWAFIRNVLAPVFMWVWRNVVVPAFEGIRKKIAAVWAVVKPILTVIGTFIRDKVAPAFSAGVTAIGKAWDRVKAIATTPVNFIIGTVLNKGIFAAYNWIVRKFGGTEIPNLPLVGGGGNPGGSNPRTAPRRGRAFARGGVLPFITDGPRAIVGEGNSRYPEYVIPTDPAYRKRALSLYEDLGSQMLADGGVIGAGFKVALGRAARAFTGNADVDPLGWLKQKIAAALGVVGESPFARMLTAIPRKIGEILLAKAKGLFDFGGGGSSPGLDGAVRFARSQAGKPYIWGAAGPGGYDCSGFVSALVNVVQGRNPYQRRFSTGTLPAGLFAPGSGAFNIGWFAGNPGHVAATVNGVPMESRGGDGVVVGSRSRGASYRYFTRHGHLKGFATGGILPGDAPFDVLDRRGRYYQPGLLDALLDVKRADSGAWLPPNSTSVVQNGTSQWEPVGPPGGNEELLAELRGLRADLARMPSGVGREVGAVIVKAGGGGRR